MQRLKGFPDLWELGFVLAAAESKSEEIELESSKGHLFALAAKRLFVVEQELALEVVADRQESLGLLEVVVLHLAEY